jgi:hypothetical protein
MVIGRKLDSSMNNYLFIFLVSTIFNGLKYKILMFFTLPEVAGPWQNDGSVSENRRKIWAQGGLCP